MLFSWQFSKLKEFNNLSQELCLSFMQKCYLLTTFAIFAILMVIPYPNLLIIFVITNLIQITHLREEQQVCDYWRGHAGVWPHPDHHSGAGREGKAGVTCMALADLALIL